MFCVSCHTIGSSLIVMTQEASAFWRIWHLLLKNPSCMYLIWKALCYKLCKFYDKNPTWYRQKCIFYRKTNKKCYSCVLASVLFKSPGRCVENRAWIRKEYKKVCLENFSGNRQQWKNIIRVKDEKWWYLWGIKECPMMCVFINVLERIYFICKIFSLRDVL